VTRPTIPRTTTGETKGLSKRNPRKARKGKIGFLVVLTMLARRSTTAHPDVTAEEEVNRRRLLPLLAGRVRDITGWRSWQLNLFVADAIYHRKWGPYLRTDARPIDEQLALVHIAWNDVIRWKKRNGARLRPEERTRDVPAQPESFPFPDDAAT
jgi:hypothetical protein